MAVEQAIKPGQHLGQLVIADKHHHRARQQRVDDARSAGAILRLDLVEHGAASAPLAPAAGVEDIGGSKISASIHPNTGRIR
jgi:hypothetical protein